MKYDNHLGMETCVIFCGGQNEFCKEQFIVSERISACDILAVKSIFFFHILITRKIITKI